MKKCIALPLILIALLLCSCESQREQIMDGDGMFQIDQDEDLTQESGEDEITETPSTPVVVDTKSVEASITGPYGRISVQLPSGWVAEEAPVDSDKMMYGLFGLILKPETAVSGQIELFCIDMFGVCGTGLESSEMTLAGNTVSVGTYDNNPHWDFITFGKAKPQIVAQHTDCSSWTDEMWGEALAILDTMKFDESITEGGVSEFIRESENDEIGVIMEVSNVSESGLTVHLRRYDKRDTGELIYGSGYSLKRLNGAAWEDVPTIIDNGVFTDEGYIIPEEGEAVMKTEWEWLYGKLTPGTYRITKVVIDSDKNEPSVNVSSYSLTAQFILSGE